MAEETKVLRPRVTLSKSDYERLKYWADKHEMTEGEYVQEAVLHMIRWENKDYDLPVAEVRRLNQLIDITTVLSQNVKSLENITVSRFESLLGLTRGDNYLLEEEDGEL
ncbi:MAG: hypothetical protein HDQ88_08320 [Clostridia bacterium]|nr:hypothetical protein [Clostridia bacterium]